MQPVHEVNILFLFGSRPPTQGTRGKRASAAGAGAGGEGQGAAGAGQEEEGRRGKEEAVGVAGGRHRPTLAQR